MASIVAGYEYDIFISYRQKANKNDGWVTEFVSNLKKELEATIKEDLSIYFDENPHDGLLETQVVEKSLEKKLNSLIFIPIISQTYCDPKCYAWQYEFCVFNKLAQSDRLGREIVLNNRNVSSRILPVKIHEISPEDQSLIDQETGVIIRAVDFIYREPGVNRPLKQADNRSDNQNKTDYWNQINKVANAVNELMNGIKKAENRLPEVKPKVDLTGFQNKNASRKKKFLISAIAGSVALIAIFLFSLYNFRSESSSSAKKSIAVMYFNNMSGDPQQDYFCDGITEEIITKLSKINELKVTSRTSVYKYKNEKKSSGEIARELGVTNILEGSVRKEGEKILVTAHLIDPASDHYIWSETYDRDLKDIFELQSDIALNIASNFQLRLSNQEKKNVITPPTLNTQAYDKYLQAASIAYVDWGLGATPMNLLKSNNLIKEAIHLDPDFSDAYRFLSWNYSHYSSFVENPKNWLDSAKLLAKTAIRKDPSNADGYDALANAFWMEGNSTEALKWQLKSHELKPYKSANLIARFYSSMNQYGKAMEWLLEAIRYDPAEYRHYISKGEIFYELEMLDSMKQTLDKARRTKPEQYYGEGWAINYYLHTDNLNEYEFVTRSRYANFDKQYAYQMAIYHFLHRNWVTADSLYAISSHADDIDAGLVKIHLGDTVTGARFLKEGIKKRMHFSNFNGPWNMYDISRAYAALGDKRFAKYLQIATDQKGWHVYSWFRHDPFFDFVRDTPEFTDLTLKMKERNESFKTDLYASMRKFYQRD